MGLRHQPNRPFPMRDPKPNQHSQNATPPRPKKTPSADVGLSVDTLTAYSPSDAPWDAHRAAADAVADAYAAAAEFERLAARVSACAGLLRFGWADDPDTGESRLRLREARFCRARYCTICQWRRSLMWRARFIRSLPAVLAEHPNARWLFLTLTVRNCQLDELRDTLHAMNAAWQRLIKRAEFQPVRGWIRTTEVTRGRDGTAHPHFHTLLLVPSSMASGRHYVTQGRWVDLWRECARLDYPPVVDVRAVRGTDPERVREAATETLKYAVKPTDLADGAWLRELTRQTHKLRFVASGGALKDVLRELDESDEAMALADGPAPTADDGSRVAFGWEKPARQYRRRPKSDKPATG